MTTVFTVESDDDLWWTLQQLTGASMLEAGFVVECVALGVIDVSGSELEWQFDADSRLRLERAWRLHHDLELHLSALPLVLELLDEVGMLREETTQLHERLRRWEG